eukprot:6637362-Alexandrium_andersonii.AAC.1
MRGSRHDADDDDADDDDETRACTCKTHCDAPDKRIQESARHACCNQCPGGIDCGLQQEPKQNPTRN